MNPTPHPRSQLELGLTLLNSSAWARELGQAARPRGHVNWTVMGGGELPVTGGMPVLSLSRSAGTEHVTVGEERRAEATQLNRETREESPGPPCGEIEACMGADAGSWAPRKGAARAGAGGDGDGRVCAFPDVAVTEDHRHTSPKRHQFMTVSLCTPEIQSGAGIRGQRSWLLWTLGGLRSGSPSFWRLPALLGSRLHGCAHRIPPHTFSSLSGPWDSTGPTQGNQAHLPNSRSFTASRLQVPSLVPGRCPMWVLEGKTNQGDTEGRCLAPKPCWASGRFWGADAGSEKLQRPRAEGAFELGSGG